MREKKNPDDNADLLKNGELRYVLCKKTDKGWKPVNRQEGDTYREYSRRRAEGEDVQIPGGPFQIFEKFVYRKDGKLYVEDPSEVQR